MIEPSSRAPISPEESPRYLGDALLTDALHAEPSTRRAPSGFLVLIIVALAAALVFWLGARSASQSSAPPLAGPFVGEDASTQASTLIVHVAGAVKKPGVYQLPFEARVNDAIQKAGGAKTNADLDAINLAAFVEDGAKIEVPQKQKPALAAAPTLPPSTSLPETTSAPTLPEYSSPLPELQTAPRAEDVPPITTAPKISKTQKSKAEKTKPDKPKVLPEVPRALTASGAQSEKAAPEYLAKHPLDLNKASAEELQLLPGVGPAMAAKIVAARTAKGGFKSVDELDDVPGIGAKKLEKLRPLVVVSSQKIPAAPDAGTQGGESTTHASR